MALARRAWLCTGISGNIYAGDLRSSGTAACNTLKELLQRQHGRIGPDNVGVAALRAGKGGECVALDAAHAHMGRYWPRSICNDIPLGNWLLAAKGTSNSMYREKPPSNTCCLRDVERHALERGERGGGGPATRPLPAALNRVNYASSDWYPVSSASASRFLGTFVVNRLELPGRSCPSPTHPTPQQAMKVRRTGGEQAGLSTLLRVQFPIPAGATPKSPTLLWQRVTLTVVYVTGFRWIRVALRFMRLHLGMPIGRPRWMVHVGYKTVHTAAKQTSRKSVAKHEHQDLLSLTMAVMSNVVGPCSPGVESRS